MNVPRESQARGPQSDALVRHATNLFERYAQLNRRFSVEDINSIVGIKTPARLSDMLAAHLVTDPQQQQDLLETLDPLERLEKICVIMGNEIEILELEATIRSRVRSQVDRTQKEFYLREQLRAIQEELGMEISTEVDELRARLNEKSLPVEVATKVRKEIDRLERTPPQSAEISVLRSYIDWVLALPWNERSGDGFDIEKTRRILDEDHYGLEGIKERIIEFLAVRQLRQRLASRDGRAQGESQGQILCFIGPPGVGKTSLGRSIANALGRKFIRISLGGVHDEAEIRGHRRTYTGALPGRIIQGIKKAGSNSPVFMLDEVDKLGMDFRGDPSSALLEVLDPEQNATFRDHYLDVPFDLSRVLFITTANVMDTVPAPLRDRMEIINLAGYTEEEKIAIAQRHLVPKQAREHGLEPGTGIAFEPEALRLLARGYTREAGVRSLEREIASVCRKVARRHAEGKTEPVRVTPDVVVSFLGVPRFELEEVEQRTRVPGVVTGLAWTPAGGDVLFVEATRMRGARTLTLTGQLGDVMKESVQAALSWVRSHAGELGIDPEFWERSDVHVHVPAGAIPKDGPSAGVTMATALVSLLTGRPVRADLAMTRGIRLPGRRPPVGS